MREGAVTEPLRGSLTSFALTLYTRAWGEAAAAWREPYYPGIQLANESPADQAEDRQRPRDRRGIVGKWRAYREMRKSAGAFCERYQPACLKWYVSPRRKMRLPPRR